METDEQSIVIAELGSCDSRDYRFGVVSCSPLGLLCTPNKEGGEEPATLDLHVLESCLILDVAEGLGGLGWGSCVLFSRGMAFC